MKDTLSVFTHALALAATLLATTALATDDRQIVDMPGDELAWETTPEGVGFAPLSGDRFVESYMAMVRLPAGLVSPAHVKSSDMFGVMLSGTMTHLAASADPSTAVPLHAGSFYRIPAGLAHVSSCISTVECVTFLYQDGKFDFLPVKP